MNSFEGIVCDIEHVYISICSSEFALRSYLYILFHELVGRPASWLFAEDKVSFIFVL